MPDNKSVEFLVRSGPRDPGVITRQTTLDAAGSGAVRRTSSAREASSTPTARSTVQGRPSSTAGPLA
jgi:hypothetical protein